MLAQRFVVGRVQRHIPPTWRRFVSTDKYADKIRQRAESEGQSIDELKVNARELWKEQVQKDKQRLQKQHDAVFNTPVSSTQMKRPQSNSETFLDESRKDATPVKPLSSILNLSKIFQSPHTAQQISNLWIAYHATAATGKGYISASIPLDAYNKMSLVAQKYPSLVVPLPRPKDPSLEAGIDSPDPYEFYFMEWAFHHSPSSGTSESNPKISTVLFTPLQEYKQRQSYATPYLVLTHYTELASTHGIVLLRGEITPSLSNADQHFLKQEDAQYLAMILQKFFLWDEKDGEGQRLLRQFHENPAEFRWEDLIQHSRI